MSKKKTVVNNRITSILIALAIFSAATLLTGCSKATGQVEKISSEKDVQIINGEADYGIKLTIIVKNVGESDSIRITPQLSSSEGEWERTQNLYFDAGQTKTLTYFFHEPTINATNIHYSVNVFPKASQ